MGCMVVEGCLIGVGGVGGIVTCYMLHVTCYIKRSRNSRKGVKNRPKNSIYK